MWIESLEKFHNPQHIFASQQENITAFSLKTKVNGDLFKT